MIRLGCIPINKHVFSLFVLGENNKDNSRVVHLDTGVYVCSKLQVLLINGLDERFNFTYDDKTKGQFVSAKDGAYSLELTSDMTLKETDENCPYFIEVICRGHVQKAKVVLVNG